MRSSFERNQHGHIILTVTGLDLTGAEEIARLEAAGCHVSDWVKSCLVSTEKDSYDKNHRLLVQSYRIALVLCKEIGKDSNRTTGNFRTHGIEHYGYCKPIAGIVPGILESVSDEKMAEMGIEYIIAPHDPINDSQGGPVLFSSVTYFGGRVLFGNWGMPHLHWYGPGAFAFLEQTRDK